ncbi:MAG: cytochrome P450 [Pseudomonadota bacterium]
MVDELFDAINRYNAAMNPNDHDPYPTYRQLLAGPPLLFDASKRLWIASRAAVIAEIMDNPDCQVRPAAEAVPKAIAGNGAGAVFSRLMRMNEGAAHANPKRVVGEALAAQDLEHVTKRSAQFAAMLGRDLPDGAALTRWLFDLPTFVVADLLGFGKDQLAPVTLAISDFVRCLSPLSTAEQLTSASSAADTLQDMLKALVPTPGSLADQVLRHAAQAGWDDQSAILSNLLGLMSQTHEATAGLIGNSVVALLTRSDLHARLRADPQLAPAFVREVARHDPAVQNTRRFVAQPTSVAGVALQAGDVILLLLGAAARDNAANPQADVFLLERVQPQLSGFGHGRHACPGRELALAIATGALQHLLALDLDAGMLSWSYAPSANARLPLFSSKGVS